MAIRVRILEHMEFSRCTILVPFVVTQAAQSSIRLAKQDALRRNSSLLRETLISWVVYSQGLSRVVSRMQGPIWSKCVEKLLGRVALQSRVSIVVDLDLERATQVILVN